MSGSGFRGRGYGPRGARSNGPSNGFNSGPRFPHPNFNHSRPPHRLQGPDKWLDGPNYPPWQQNKGYGHRQHYRGNSQYRPNGRGRSSNGRGGVRFSGPGRPPAPQFSVGFNRNQGPRALLPHADQVVEEDKCVLPPQTPLLGSEEERQQKITETADKLKQKLSSITEEDLTNFWEDDFSILPNSIIEEEGIRNKGIPELRHEPPELDLTFTDFRDIGRVDCNNSRFDDIDDSANNDCVSIPFANEVTDRLLSTNDEITVVNESAEDCLIILDSVQDDVLDQPDVLLESDACQQEAFQELLDPECNLDGLQLQCDIIPEGGISLNPDDADGSLTVLNVDEGIPDSTYIQPIEDVVNENPPLDLIDIEAAPLSLPALNDQDVSQVDFTENPNLLQVAIQDIEGDTIQDINLDVHQDDGVETDLHQTDNLPENVFQEEACPISASASETPENNSLISPPLIEDNQSNIIGDTVSPTCSSYNEMHNVNNDTQLNNPPHFQPRGFNVPPRFGPRIPGPRCPGPRWGFQQNGNNAFFRGPQRLPFHGNRMPPPRHIVPFQPNNLVPVPFDPRAPPPFTHNVPAPSHDPQHHSLVPFSSNDLPPSFDPTEPPPNIRPVPSTESSNRQDIAQTMSPLDTRQQPTNVPSNNMEIMQPPPTFDPREPPPRISNVLVNANENLPEFNPQQPPPKIHKRDETLQPPPIFDPRLSSQERSKLLAPINPPATHMMPGFSLTPVTPNFAQPPPMNMPSHQAFMPTIPVNFPPVLPQVNPGPVIVQEFALPPPPMTIASVPPPLPQEVPLEKDSNHSQGVNMDDDGLEDMQEAMEFAKQIMNMTEDLKSNQSASSELIELPIGPLEIPVPMQDTPCSSSVEDVSGNAAKKQKKKESKIKKIKQTLVSGPVLEKQVELEVADDEQDVQNRDRTSEDVLLAGDQIRPKVVFNLNSKTKVIPKQDEWHRSTARAVETKETQPVTKETPPVTRETPQVTRETQQVTREIPQVTREIPQVSREIPQVTRETQQVTRETQQVSREPQNSQKEKTHSKRHSSESKRNNVNPNKKQQREHHSKMSLTRSAEVPRPFILEKPSDSSRHQEYTRDVAKLHSHSSAVHKSQRSRKEAKKTAPTSESTWKNRVISRFLKMSKNDICNMVNNSSLRKFDIAMKHLVKERRSSLSLEMRNTEDEKMKEYDREEFMNQLNAMLDPGAVVGITDLPTEFIHHLSEVLQLDPMPFEAESSERESAEINEVKTVDQTDMPQTYASEYLQEEIKEAPSYPEYPECENVYIEQIEEQPVYNKEESLPFPINPEMNLNISRENTTSSRKSLMNKTNPEAECVYKKQQPLFNEADLDDILLQVTERTKVPPIKILPRKRSLEMYKDSSVPQRVTEAFKCNAYPQIPTKTAADLDDIFSAGIARAKSLHKSADSEHSRSRKSSSEDRNTFRAERYERWEKKEQEDPDSFRNLTKEEWEAKYGPQAYMRKTSSNSAENLSRDSRNYHSQRYCSSDSPMRHLSMSPLLREPPAHNPERSMDPYNEFVEARRAEHSGSSTDNTTTTSDSDSDEETVAPDVTKLLKVIKEKEKIAKKKSLNETIRDEVAAEIEKKWKEKSKHKERKSRKRERRKRDKREKRKKEKKKRRKRNSHSEMSKSSEQSEEYRMLTEDEIKKEVVVKEEPLGTFEDNTPFHSGDGNTSVPPTSSNKATEQTPQADSTIPLLGRQPNPVDTSDKVPPPARKKPTIISMTIQPKTKAQLKQMPESTNLAQKQVTEKLSEVDNSGAGSSTNTDGRMKKEHAEKNKGSQVEEGNNKGTVTALLVNNALPQANVSTINSSPQTNLFTNNLLPQANVSTNDSSPQVTVSPSNSFPQTSPSGNNSSLPAAVSANNSMPEIDLSANAALPQTNLSTNTSLPQINLSSNITEPPQTEVSDNTTANATSLTSTPTNPDTEASNSNQSTIQKVFAAGTSSAETKSSYKKIDIKAYKERALQRRLREEAKLREKSSVKLPQVSQPVLPVNKTDNETGGSPKGNETKVTDIDLSPGKIKDPRLAKLKSVNVSVCEDSSKEAASLEKEHKCTDLAQSNKELPVHSKSAGELSGCKVKEKSATRAIDSDSSSPKDPAKSKEHNKEAKAFSQDKVVKRDEVGEKAETEEKKSKKLPGAVESNKFKNIRSEGSKELKLKKEKIAKSAERKKKLKAKAMAAEKQSKLSQERVTEEAQKPLTANIDSVIGADVEKASSSNVPESQLSEKTEESCVELATCPENVVAEDNIGKEINKEEVDTHPENVAAEDSIGKEINKEQVDTHPAVEESNDKIVDDNEKIVDDNEKIVDDNEKIVDDNEKANILETEQAMDQEIKEIVGYQLVEEQGRIEAEGDQTSLNCITEESSAKEVEESISNSPEESTARAESVSTEKLGKEEDIERDMAPFNQTSPVPIEEPVVEDKFVEDKFMEDKPVEDEPVENEPVEDEPVEDEPVEDKFVENEPMEDEPVEDKFVEDKFMEDKFVEDKFMEDKFVEDKFVEDKFMEDNFVEDKFMEDKPVEDEPVEDKPVEDKSVEDKPVEDKPAEDKFVEEKSLEDEFTEDKPVEDTPVFTEDLPQVHQEPYSVDEDIHLDDKENLEDTVADTTPTPDTEMGTEFVDKDSTNTEAEAKEKEESELRSPDSVGSPFIGFVAESIEDEVNQVSKLADVDMSIVDTEEGVTENCKQQLETCSYDESSIKAVESDKDDKNISVEMKETDEAESASKLREEEGSSTENDVDKTMPDSFDPVCNVEADAELMETENTDTAKESEAYNSDTEQNVSPIINLDSQDTFGEDGEPFIVLDEYIDDPDGKALEKLSAFGLDLDDCIARDADIFSSKHMQGEEDLMDNIHSSNFNAIDFKELSEAFDKDNITPAKEEETNYDAANIMLSTELVTHSDKEETNIISSEPNIEPSSEASENSKSTDTTPKDTALKVSTESSPTDVPFVEDVPQEPVSQASPMDIVETEQEQGSLPLLHSPETLETVHPEAAETVRPEDSETVRSETSETVRPEASEIVRPEASEIVRPEASEIVCLEASETVFLEASEIVRPKASETVRPETPTKPTVAMETAFGKSSDSLSPDAAPLPETKAELVEPNKEADNCEKGSEKNVDDSFGRSKLILTTEPSISFDETTEASTSIAKTTEASTSIDKTTEASTPIAKTTEASTSIAKTTEASTPIAKTTEASTSIGKTTKASTSIDKTTEASTFIAKITEASTPIAKTTEPSTSFGKTTKASTSIDKTTEASTPIAKTTEASTSIGKTTKVSTSIDKITKASTFIAKTTEASAAIAKTTEVSTPIAKTTEASTSIGKTTKASTSIDKITKASTFIAKTTEASAVIAKTTEVSTPIAKTTEASTSIGKTTKASSSIDKTTAASTSIAKTTEASTSIGKTPKASISIDKTTAVSTSIAKTTEASTFVAKTTEAPIFIDKPTEVLTFIDKTTRASTAIDKTTEASTPIAKTTEASTSIGKTTKASTSIDKTTKASTFIAKTTEASAAIAKTTEVSTPIAKTTEASTSIGKTTKASTSIDKTTEASTSIDKTTRASTPIDKTTAASTSIDKTTAASTSMDKTTDAPTPIAKSAEASTSIDKHASSSSTDEKKKSHHHHSEKRHKSASKSHQKREDEALHKIKSKSKMKHKEHKKHSVPKNLVEEAVQSDTVKVTYPNTKEAIIARMVAIDVEIHQLMTEKMTLYDMLTNNALPVDKDLPQKNTVNESKEVETVVMRPRTPSVLMSQLIQNIEVTNVVTNQCAKTTAESASSKDSAAIPAQPSKSKASKHEHHAEKKANSTHTRSSDNEEAAYHTGDAKSSSSRKKKKPKWAIKWKEPHDSINDTSSEAVTEEKQTSDAVKSILKKASTKQKATEQASTSEVKLPVGSSETPPQIDKKDSTSTDKRETRSNEVNEKAIKLPEPQVPSDEPVKPKTPHNRDDNVSPKENESTIEALNDTDTGSSTIKVPENRTPERSSIYSDDSTWDSLHQNTSIDDQKKPTTGLALLEETYRKELEKTRRVRSDSRRRRRKKMLNALSPVKTLTPEEEELPLSTLYSKKVHAKKKSQSPGDQPVEKSKDDQQLWTNVDEVINAVAENRTADLYVKRSKRQSPSGESQSKVPNVDQTTSAKQEQANDPDSNSEQKPIEEEERTVSSASQNIEEVCNEPPIDSKGTTSSDGKDDASNDLQLTTPCPNASQDLSGSEEQAPKDGAINEPQSIEDLLGTSVNIDESVLEPFAQEVAENNNAETSRAVTPVESSEICIVESSICSVYNDQNILDIPETNVDSEKVGEEAADEKNKEPDQQEEAVKVEKSVSPDAIVSGNFEKDQDNSNEPHSSKSVGTASEITMCNSNENSNIETGDVNEESSKDTLPKQQAQCEKDNAVDNSEKFYDVLKEECLLRAKEHRGSQRRRESERSNKSSSEESSRHRTSTSSSLSENTSSLKSEEAGVKRTAKRKRGSSRTPLRRSSRYTEETTKRIKVEVDASVQSTEQEPQEKNAQIHLPNVSPALPSSANEEAETTTNSKKHRSVQKTSSRKRCMPPELDIHPSQSHAGDDLPREAKRCKQQTVPTIMNCQVRLVDSKHTILKPNVNPNELKKYGISTINPYVYPNSGHLEHLPVTNPVQSTPAKDSSSASAKRATPTTEASQSQKVVKKAEDPAQSISEEVSSAKIGGAPKPAKINTPASDGEKSGEKCTEPDREVMPVLTKEQVLVDISQESEKPDVEIVEEKAIVTKNQHHNDSGSTLTVIETKDDKEQPRTQYTVHKGPILDIKVFENTFLAASEDGRIYRYSQASNGILNIYKGHKAAVTCLYVFNTSGTDINKEWMFSGSLDGTLRCYNVTTGLQIRDTADVGSPIQCMDEAWGTIFIGTKSGHVSRYHVKTGAIKTNSIQFSDKSVLALKATNEGPRRVLIVASRSQPITIRDAQSGLFLRTICGQKSHTVYSLMRDHNLIYCGTSSTSILVFDFTNGEQMMQYDAGVGIVCMRLFKKLLFAGCYDGNIYVFNTKDRRLVCSIPGPGNMLLSMEVIENKIIAGSKDKRLQSWQMSGQVRALL